jgi:uncharacterized membrane-anchored protein YjiN (DUF445 family)
MNEETMSFPMQSTDRTNDGDAPEDAARSNLDKIRDILFGTQARESDARFAALEKRLAQETDELRNELNRRFESLESLLRREIAALGERLYAEQQERNAVATGLAEAQHSAVQMFDEKIAHLINQVNERHQEVNQKIDYHANALAEQLRQRHEESAQMLERTAQELRANKADRASLAMFFADIAHKLNPEAQS